MWSSFVRQFLKMGKKIYLYALNIYFGQHSIGIEPEVLYKRNFGRALEEGTKSDVIYAFKSGIETAITVFIKANFDL